jgi:hypothetical protein
MPAIISFVTTFIVPTLSILLSAIAPVAAIVMGFTLSRLTKIPRYVKLLRWLYEDSDPDSQARQYATLGLLLLSGILMFMAYSFVPGTALPVVGSVMTAIAAMLAVVVSLTALDLIFTLNEGYWLDRLRQNNPEDVDDLLGDIAALSKSQIRTRPSSPPLTNWRPSGRNATDRTASESLSNVCTNCPCGTPQTLIVPSSLPLTNRVPSGENATDRTTSECPVRV